MKATREEVYRAVDSERDYQDSLGPDRTELTSADRHRTVGEYLTMLATYLREAQDNWTRYAGDAKALASIRKIAGISVHCMEDHGAPQRQR
jgi:hypothetical protein